MQFYAKISHRNLKNQIFRGCRDCGIFRKESKRMLGSEKIEIDFVCNLDENRIYIQSALSMPDEEKRNPNQAGEHFILYLYNQIGETMAGEWHLMVQAVV